MRRILGCFNLLRLLYLLLSFFHHRPTYDDVGTQLIRRIELTLKIAMSNSLYTSHILDIHSYSYRSNGICSISETHLVGSGHSPGQTSADIPPSNIPPG